MKRTILVVAGLCGLIGVTGCMSTAAKQAYYGATGASARYFEIKNIGAPNALDKYPAVAVEMFDPSPMMGAIPPTVPAEVQAAIIQRLTEAKLFASVSRLPVQGGLVVRGKFHDYDAGGSAIRAVGFGVDPFVTAQIEIIDVDANQVLGVAMVTGTVKSAVRTGTRELADGVGKAVKGLMERHHTKPEEKAGSASRPSGQQGPAAKKGWRWPWSKHG